MTVGVGWVLISDEKGEPRSEGGSTGEFGGTASQTITYPKDHAKTWVLTQQARGADILVPVMPCGRSVCSPGPGQAERALENNLLGGSKSNCGLKA